LVKIGPRQRDTGSSTHVLHDFWGVDQQQANIYLNQDYFEQHLRTKRKTYYAKYISLLARQVQDNKQDTQRTYNVTLRHVHVTTCSGEAIRITHSECVSAALVFSTQSSCAVLHRHLRPLWLYHIFQHYLINGIIFRKTLLGTNCTCRRLQRRLILSPVRLRGKRSFEMVCHTRLFLFPFNLKTEVNTVFEVYKSFSHIWWKM
jgi:hypothetical protein